MRRKILIIIMLALIIIMAGLFIKRIYKDKADVFSDELISILNDVNELSTKINRYQIKKSGSLEISANYKGAHGENFPHDFVFNYALKNNKIYFENEDGYNSLNINAKLLSFLEGLTNSMDIDKVSLSNSSINFTNNSVVIDPTYINSIYGTDFKNIKATVYFENFLSKNIERTVIEIDDIIITRMGQSYTIEKDEDNIKFSFNKSGYSLNINDYIKMNVFNETTDDRYTLVVGNYVYSVTVKTDGIDFVASTGASIYNSINVIAKYEDYDLNLEEELDVIDNPITRYFSEVK